MDDFLLPDLAEVQAELQRLQVGCDAAELHGTLSGFVCGGGSPGERGWMQQLQLDAEPGDAADSPLQRLRAQTLAQLGDPDCGFQLLLPDDDASIRERAEALTVWTRGFLGGFGLAAGATPALSDEATEALQDLAAIAASSLSCEDPDSDEESLEEIAEFVRVVALLLHSDCHGGGAVASPSSRLH